MRKYVMTIAGFDPSAGAGLLADIKTFEQHGVYGVSVNSANTLQTDTTFHTIQWTSLKDVLQAVDVLLDAYPIEVVKTGIVPSITFLWQVVSHIKKANNKIKIIVDPVLRSTTGFDFQNEQTSDVLQMVLEHSCLITPNVDEAKMLTGLQNANTAGLTLAKHCAVLLKGGHHETTPGVDYLYTGDTCITLMPGHGRVSPKHGSGCVLSAAIAANLAQGETLPVACQAAKHYVERFLNSNTSLLGYHHV